MHDAKNYVHRLAIEYRDAGIGVIPLRLDGSKAPALSSWKPFFNRLATDDELYQWFRHPAGIGMIAGAVSGGLEVLDFDDGSLFQPWRSLASSIVDRLPVIETPSGGWHVLYRCNEICGNEKIAKDLSQADKRTLIETRGERGYIVAEGSPCETHATGLPYVQYSGPKLPTIPTVTPEERRELWKAARTFDKRGEAFITKLKRAALTPKYIGSSTEHPVIAAFNQRWQWSEILEPYGWRSIDGVIWSRPGKDSFVKSAEVFAARDGNEVLVVWSGNAGALAPDSGDKRTWNKFRAWTQLKFGGDGKAAFNAAIQEVAA